MVTVGFWGGRGVVGGGVVARGRRVYADIFEVVCFREDWVIVKCRHLVFALVESGEVWEGAVFSGCELVVLTLLVGLVEPRGQALAGVEVLRVLMDFPGVFKVIFKIYNVLRNLHIWLARRELSITLP